MVYGAGKSQSQQVKVIPATPSALLAGKEQEKKRRQALMSPPKTVPLRIRGYPGKISRFLLKGIPR